MRAENGIDTVHLSVRGRDRARGDRRPASGFPRISPLIRCRSPICLPAAALARVTVRGHATGRASSQPQTRTCRRPSGVPTSTGGSRPCRSQTASSITRSGPALRWKQRFPVTARIIRDDPPNFTDRRLGIGVRGCLTSSATRPDVRSSVLSRRFTTSSASVTRPP